MKPVMTWAQAFKKNDGKWVVSVAVILSLISIAQGELTFVYFAGIVLLGFLVAIVGTRYGWRGFI